jgi:F0F1-type ATP synthase assembly protein I
MHNDSQHGSVSGQANEPEPSKKNGWAQFAKYSEIAFIFPAATVTGLLIGAALDRWLHTTWIFIVGLFVGIIAGFVQVVRIGLSSKDD